MQRFCSARSWPFCFIGGLAVLRWGEPRTTRDVDLTLLTGFGGEQPYVDALLTRFAARLPDARDFALRNRVLLLRSDHNVGIDVTLAGLPYEERAVERASLWPVEDEYSLITCCAEDLLVLKAFAGRPQDWLDIETVVDRQRDHLDSALVLAEVTPLLAVKGTTADLARLESILSG